jgi:hypothetical protein
LAFSDIGKIIVLIILEMICLLKFKYLLITGMCLMAVSIKAQYRAVVANVDSCLNILKVYSLERVDSLIDSRRMAYPVYYFKQADINGDGIDDMVLGTIKTANFDKVSRKRVNIWTLRKGVIVPLWLGSKMPHPLYDFRVRTVDDINHIVTIEYEADGLYLVAEYRWLSFGLKFIRYIAREVSLNDALSLIDKEL